jgi:hypothetical protein
MASSGFDRKSTRSAIFPLSILPPDADSRPLSRPRVSPAPVALLDTFMSLSAVSRGVRRKWSMAITQREIGAAALSATPKRLPTQLGRQSTRFAIRPMFALCSHAPVMLVLTHFDEALTAHLGPPVRSDRRNHFRTDACSGTLHLGGTNCGHVRLIDSMSYV